jgi:hypothetical protein
VNRVFKMPSYPSFVQLTLFANPIRKKLDVEKGMGRQKGDLYDTRAQQKAQGKKIQQGQSKAGKKVKRRFFSVVEQ